MKMNNKIKTILVITAMLLAVGFLVSANQITIYSKELPISPLGAGPPADSSIHIGGVAVLPNIHTYVCDDTDAQGYEGHGTDGGFETDIAELSGTEYTAVSVDDANSATYKQNNAGRFSFHRANFTIDEAIDTITQIDITWKGYGWGSAGGSRESFWVSTNMIILFNIRTTFINP